MGVTSKIKYCASGSLKYAAMFCLIPELENVDSDLFQMGFGCEGINKSAIELFQV